MKKIIENNFKEKKIMTIEEIYECVAEGLKENNSKILQHSVRGSIHALKKNNFITQINLGKYKITESEK